MLNRNVLAIGFAGLLKDFCHEMAISILFYSIHAGYRDLCGRLRFYRGSYDALSALLSWEPAIIDLNRYRVSVRRYLQGSFPLSISITLTNVRSDVAPETKTTKKAPGHIAFIKCF